MVRKKQDSPLLSCLFCQGGKPLMPGPFLNARLMVPCPVPSQSAVAIARACMRWRARSASSVGITADIMIDNNGLMRGAT